MSRINTRNTVATLVSATVLAGGLAVAAQPASAAERPANDLFNRAEGLTSQGCEASTDGTNVGARGQAAEQAMPGAAPVHSVWFKWRSPVSDTVVIDTEGSDFDTVLGVYRGRSLRSLRVIDINDDAEGAADLSSEVTFEARRNVTYRIAVDGFRAQRGDYVLNVVC
ncbi:MAG TPA: hypothetical protein VER39_16160 [Nocardioidaceae bacterium]|nr:hypothetical protein [Nocardioidaceae bacterium]